MKAGVSFSYKREEARYGPLIRIEDVPLEYDSMANMCKRAIEQCEEIVFSNKEFKVPYDLFDSNSNL